MSFLQFKLVFFGLLKKKYTYIYVYVYTAHFKIFLVSIDFYIKNAVRRFYDLFQQNVMRIRICGIGAGTGHRTANTGTVQVRTF